MKINIVEEYGLYWYSRDVLGDFFIPKDIFINNLQIIENYQTLNKYNNIIKNLKRNNI
jgi:hypothetical protein